MDKKVSCGASASDRYGEATRWFPARWHSVSDPASICDSASRFDSGSEGSSAQRRVEVSKRAGDKIQSGLLFLSDRRNPKRQELPKESVWNWFELACAGLGRRRSSTDLGFYLGCRSANRDETEFGWWKPSFYWQRVRGSKKQD